jgi:hypothetical protein
MHLQFCLIRTRMTLIIRIFTDIFCIRANQCHPFNPCSISFFLLTDDVWIMKGIGHMAQFQSQMISTAIYLMAVNAYKRWFVYLLFRKYFMILRASTRYVIRKINVQRRYNFRQLG